MMTYRRDEEENEQMRSPDCFLKRTELYGMFGHILVQFTLRRGEEVSATRKWIWVGGARLSAEGSFGGNPA